MRGLRVQAACTPSPLLSPTHPHGVPQHHLSLLDVPCVATVVPLHCVQPTGPGLPLPRPWPPHPRTRGPATAAARESGLLPGPPTARPTAPSPLLHRHRRPHPNPSTSCCCCPARHPLAGPGPCSLWRGTWLGPPPAHPRRQPMWWPQHPWPSIASSAPQPWPTCACLGAQSPWGRAPERASSRVVTGWTFAPGWSTVLVPLPVQVR
jgi:hypothetical protein